MADGRLIKALRDQTGKTKSDVNDVILIKTLACDHPEVFRELTAHKREAINNEMAYAYYRRITRVIASLKNHRKAFRRQFGEDLPQLLAPLRVLEREKGKAANHFKTLKNVAKGLAIRGLGPISLAGILVKADPRRFRSLQAYLRYCGLRAEARASGSFNRHVRAIYHQMARDVIMHRDPSFYALYGQIKANLRNRHLDYPKGKIDGMAKNRLATLLAKNIYRAIREMPGKLWNDKAV